MTKRGEDRHGASKTELTCLVQVPHQRHVMEQPSNPAEALSIEEEKDVEHELQPGLVFFAMKPKVVQLNH